MKPVHKAQWEAKILDPLQDLGTLLGAAPSPPGHQPPGPLGESSEDKGAFSPPEANGMSLGPMVGPHGASTPLTSTLGKSTLLFHAEGDGHVWITTRPKMAKDSHRRHSDAPHCSSSVLLAWPAPSEGCAEGSKMLHTILQRHCVLCGLTSCYSSSLPHQGLPKGQRTHLAREKQPHTPQGAVWARSASGRTSRNRDAGSSCGGEGTGRPGCNLCTRGWGQHLSVLDSGSRVRLY